MVRKLLSFAVAAALGGAPLAASAAGSLVGTWHGTAAVSGMNCTFDRTITQSGTYFEVARCGSLATSQSGVYHVLPNNAVAFLVRDFAPRQRYVMDSGYSGHYETNAKPPGGTFIYTINATTLTLRDVNRGGTLTYHRVR